MGTGVARQITGQIGAVSLLTPHQVLLKFHQVLHNDGKFRPDTLHSYTVKVLRVRAKVAQRLLATYDISLTSSSPILLSRPVLCTCSLRLLGRAS